MIAIRAAHPDDAAAIAAIYAPHVLAGVVSFETQAPDADTMRARMAGADGLYPWIVATLRSEEGGEEAVIGYAYAARFREREAYRWVVETTIYVADVSQRAGVFREVGHKHGRWIDVGYWQRELAEPATHPAEPRPFAEVGVVRDPVAAKHR